MIQIPIDFILYLCNYFILTHKTYEASHGAGAQSVTIKSTGSIPARGDEIYLFKFIFPFLLSGVEAKARG